MSTQQIADTKAERRARFEAQLEQKAAGQPWFSGSANVKPIMAHQWYGVCYGTAARRWILGDGVGLGKTRQAAGWIAMVDAQRVVVVAENNIAGQFANELEELIPQYPVVRLFGLTKKPRDEAYSRLAFTRRAIVVVNFEAWRQDQSGLTTLILWKPDTVVVDEAHNLKATATGNFQNVAKLILLENVCPDCGRSRAKGKNCQACGFRWEVGVHGEMVNHHRPPTAYLSLRSVKNVMLLTGTPILNSPDDLFALIHLIMPTWFPTHSGFRADYLVKNHFTNRWEFQLEAAERIHAKIKGRYLAREKKDVFVRDNARGGYVLPDGSFLPDQDVTVIKLHLDPEKYPLQYRTIKQITEQAKILLDSGETMTLFHQITVLLRKRQANVWPGGIVWKAKDGTVLMRVGDEVRESVKLDAIVSETRKRYKEGKRQVVFSQFKEPLVELERRLRDMGIRVARLDGDTKPSDRAIIKDDFYKAKTPGRGRYDVLLAQYRSGGTGLNFTAAQTLHIADEEWNPGKRDQSYGRVYRIGQDVTTEVLVYRVMNSVDIWQANLIATKEELVNSFDEAARSDTEAIEDLMGLIQSGEIL